MKRENYRAKNGSLWNASTDSKRVTFVILINHANAPIRKGKTESNEHSKEGGQPKSVCGKERDARQSQKLWRNR